MAGATFSPEESVKIFDLLGLDPRHLVECSIAHSLKKIRTAYRKAALIAHPDKDPTRGHETIQFLNKLKDHLSNFNERQMDTQKVTELLKWGIGGRNRRKSMLKKEVGSSRFDPIILDAPEISYTHTKQDHIYEGKAKTTRCQSRRTRYRSDKRVRHT